MHLKILSYDIPSLPRHFSISGIWGHFRYFSLWVLPHWYLMNWCAADVTDGDKKKEREIELLWQHCGVNITLFFFPLFLHPTSTLSAPHALSLHHVLLLVPSLSDFHSVLSPGGVRAGLLCPLWVGRVFKLYCSWQAWGKPVVVVDWVRQNDHVWSHKEEGHTSVWCMCKCQICAGNGRCSVFKRLIWDCVWYK